MPTYEFQCPDGTIIERQFKISEAPSEIPVPDGSGMAVRIMSAGAGLHFKGSGFYITDYGKDGKKDQRTAAAKADSSTVSDGAQSDSAKPDNAKAENVKAESERASGAKSESAKADVGTTVGAKSDSAKSGATSSTGDRSDRGKSESSSASAKPAESRKESPKPTAPPRKGDA